MMGQMLDVLDVGRDGPAGDRRWAVRDLERGGIRGAKKISGLMKLEARYLDGSGGDIEITLRSGETVRSDDPDVDERLSRDVDHPVSLDACAPAGDLDHFRRGAPDNDDLDAELRAIFGREAGEPLPDLSRFPPEIIEFESPPGTYVDAYPVHLVTTTSLETLAELEPDSVVDVRRFRPNIVVETDGGESLWPEREWIGRSVRLGSVTLDVVGPCPRCVMVTHAVGDLDHDTRLLRRIVADADQDFGVYATVSGPGTVSLGDQVSLTI